MTLSRRRLISSLLLIALLVILVLPPLRAPVLENRLLRHVDHAAEELIEASFTRALAAFALARATNGVISVLQESEVAVSPAGIGVSLALGQVLDPLNDLVERFSWVMLVALTSLGVQRFLLEVGPWIGLQLLGSLGLLLVLAGLWLQPRILYDLGGLGRRLLFLALVVRFAVPLAAGLNEQVYRHFLAQRYAIASQGVAVGNADLEQVGAAPGTSASIPWWQSLLPRGGDGHGIDFDAVRRWLEQRSSRLIDGFLDLLVVFLLNTVLLPIAFLWGIFRLFQALTGMPLLPRLERQIRDRISPGTDRNAAGSSADLPPSDSPSAGG